MCVLADLPEGLFDLIQRLVEPSAFAATMVSVMVRIADEISSLLHSFPSTNMERRSFTLGVQLDASPATISTGTPLALDLAPTAYQTGGDLAVVILGLDLLPQLFKHRGTCSGL